MVKLLKPAIERRLEKADSDIGTRKRAAEHICCFLEANPKTAHLLEREKPKPLYVSKKRLEWLDERNKAS